MALRAAFARVDVHALVPCLVTLVRNTRFAKMGASGPGIPVNLRGSFCWTSGIKSFGQTLEVWEKKESEAFGLDIHDHRPLSGPFGGAVSDHGGVPENCPLASIGRFPFLMGRFPTLMGRFPECLNGPFSLSKIPWETAL